MYSQPSIHLPEVLHLVALHLTDVNDLLKCRQVCRLWHMLFTPYIARAVHDRTRPWYDITQSSDQDDTATIAAADAKNSFRTAFLQKHKEYVRHLSIYDQWLLDTAVRMPFIRLTSLRIFAHFSSSTRDASLPAVTEFAGIPKYLFAETARRFPAPITFERTQAFWQIVRNNPGLEHLWISTSARDSLFEFATISPGVLTTEAEAFLMDTLLNLPKLRSLQLGIGGLGAFVLKRLPTHFPQITTFTFTGKVEFLSELPPGFCTTLQNLIIQVYLGEKDLHRVMEAFPCLLSIDLAFSFSRMMDRGLPNVNLMNEKEKVLVVHRTIERLSAMNIADLASLNVCFPKVKSVVPFRKIEDFNTLVSILKMLPGLEHLHVMNIEGDQRHENNNANIGASIQGKDTIEEVDTQLRTLIIRNHRWHSAELTVLVSKSPHLVKLEVCHLSPESLVTVARSCKNLEYLHFNAMQYCPQEIQQVLLECPKLKSLQGRGLTILVDELLQGPGWACHGLQRLQCNIIGVPQLTCEEEAFLQSIQQNRFQLLEAELADENRIMEKQRQAWMVQEQIMQYLAHYPKLLHSDIGFAETFCLQYYEYCTCMLNWQDYNIGSESEHYCDMQHYGTFGRMEIDQQR